MSRLPYKTLESTTAVSTPGGGSTKPPRVIKSHCERKMETRQTIPSATPEISIGGMNCNNCARHVTEAIQSVPGVRSATVILDSGRASVRWNSGAEQNVSAVIDAVQKAGYTAKEIQADASAGCETRHARWQINLWLGVAVTTALMAGEWGFGLGLG